MTNVVNMANYDEELAAKRPPYEYQMPESGGGTVNYDPERANTFREMNLNLNC
jgi:hypothetical protein